MNTVLPSLGSPGSFTSAGAASPPPATAAPTLWGTSFSVTSTVPPCDSRNAVTAHPGQVGPPGALLADPVTDLARALRLVDLLAGLHELGWRDLAALERQLLGRLRLDLGDGVGEPRIATHDGERENADLDADGDTHARRSGRCRRP